MFKFKQAPNKHLKSALLSSFLIVFLLVSLGFLLRNVGRESKDILKYKEKISSKINALSFLASAKKQSREAEKYMSALNNVFPGEDKLLDFKDKTQRLANKNGVGMGFKFGAAKENPKGFKSMSFELFISGPLEKIINFIGDLENTFYIVKLSSLNFQRKVSQNKVEAKINGLVFYK